MKCNKCGLEVEECMTCTTFFEVGDEIICSPISGCHYCNQVCLIDETEIANVVE